MRRFFAVYDRFLDFCGYFPGFVVVLLALGITADVIGRNLGADSIRGILELTEYGLILMAFTGSAYVHREGRHVKVDIILNALNPKSRLILTYVIRALTLVILIIVAKAAIDAALQAAADDSVLMRYYALPEWILIAIVAWGIGLLGVEAARQLFFPHTIERREASQPEGH